MLPCACPANSRTRATPPTCDKIAAKCLNLQYLFYFYAAILKPAGLSGGVRCRMAANECKQMSGLLRHLGKNIRRDFFLLPLIGSFLERLTKSRLKFLVH